MKKILCAAFAVLLTAGAIFAFRGDAFAASEDKGIYLSFIVDDEALAGCTENASLFDTVLDVVRSSGFKITFFTDVQSYDENYAAALMKLIAANIPFGAVADSRESALEAIKYEKYASKTVSRLLLANPDAKKAGDDFFTVYYDILLKTALEIGYGNVSNYGGANIAVEINAETARAVLPLLDDIKSDGMYIITPTQYGLVLYGKEE